MEQSPRRWFVALLLLTLLKGWVWATVFPPFQAADELLHLGYARDIARTGQIMVTPRDQFTPEEVITLQMIDLTGVSGYRRPLNLSPVRVAELTELRQQLPEAERYAEPQPILFAPFFARHHPPFFYFLGAVVEKLARPRDLFTHLALARGLAVLCSGLTVTFAYWLGQELFPARPRLWLGLATTMSFLPMVTYLSAVYSNQALEITCFTALFWLIARLIRQGMSDRLGLILGVVWAIGLWTKVSLLVMAPVLGLALLYDLWRGSARPRAWVWVFLFPALLAGPWYANYFQISRSGLADARPATATCPTLWPYLLNLNHGWLARKIWNESLGIFGTMDTLFPPLVNQVTAYTFWLALLGWGWLGIRAIRRQPLPFSRQQGLTFALLALAWVGVHLFFLLIGYLVSCDQVGEYGTGRLVIPVAAAPLMLFFVGWSAWAGRWQNWLINLMVLITIGLNSYALLDRLAWRYYGLQEVVAYDERVTYSQPLTQEQPVRQCLAVPSGRLARVDVWLYQPGQASGDLTLTVNDATGQMLVQRTQPNRRGAEVMPTHFPFAAQPVEGEVCLALAGTFSGPVQVWTDGNAAAAWNDGSQAQPGHLAVRLYQTIALTALPNRMALVSPLAFPPTFFWFMGLAYGIFTSLYALAFLARSRNLDLTSRDNQHTNTLRP